MKHFHTDFADLAHFDLVVNTALIGIANSCATIRAAVECLQPASKIPV
jgi:cytidylate kinase